MQILRGETRLQDLITGFIDPNEQIADPNARAAAAAAEPPPEEESDDPDAEEEAPDTGPGSRGSRRALEEAQAAAQALRSRRWPRRASRTPRRRRR